MSERIGFISTRFAGIDGVSLESAKWAQVLWDYKHLSFWYGGLLHRAPEASMTVPESFFGHPENEWINRAIWGKTRRSTLVSRRIRDLAEYIKYTLRDFIGTYELTALIIENALAIPIHVPLGIAVTELLAEMQIPAIAHHHDFYWERTRFQVNAVPDFLDMAFPPRSDSLQHVVINHEAQEELSWRKGVPSILIPNVLDFENPPQEADHYSSDIRQQIGISPEEFLILQPTRIIPRKGIEHAIKLVEMLEDPRCKLVISHEAGDEGYEYMNALKEIAAESNVDLRFIATQVGEQRKVNNAGKKVYTLNDIYPHADLVTYPSLYEGFGNAFLEAIYYRIPLVVNRYSIFARDIEPKGFILPIMDGFITNKVVEEVRRILNDKEYKKQVVDHNYQLGLRFYSYSVLRRTLRTLITNITGLPNL